jgi:hypothetical protein
MVVGYINNGSSGDSTDSSGGVTTKVMTIGIVMMVTAHK